MLEALLDPKRRAKAKEEQDKRRELMSPLLAHHPAAAAYRYGVAREAFARAQIEPTNRLGDNCYNILAEALALQGDFAGAVEAMPRGSQTSRRSDNVRDEYAAMATAVANIGARLCDCPERVVVKQQGDAKGITKHTLDDVQQIMLEGVRLVTLRRCSLCKTISAFEGG